MLGERNGNRIATNMSMRGGATLNHVTARIAPKAVAHLRKQAAFYRQEQSGSMAIFGLFSFVIILLLAGIGVDIVRHETLRAELTNTQDRASLAATNLDNSLDPVAVVTDYFAKAGLSQYLHDVDVQPLGDGRQVTVITKTVIPTYFMKFAGVDTLQMTSTSVAEQGLSGIEISMVLDVSGSMGSYSRLSNLKTAAADFTEVVFDNAEPEDIAISVIPYATQVNAGASILGTLDLLNAHSKSHCINFEDDDFLSTDIDYASAVSTRIYDQTMDHDSVYNDWDNLDMAHGYTTCSTETGREILAFSNNKTEIDNMINSLTAHGNTSIDIGVKWGAALLDTSAQTVNSALGADGSTPGDVADVQKFMVVMTDGSHTNQYFIPDPYRDDYDPADPNTRRTEVYQDLYDDIYVGEEYNNCTYSYWSGWSCGTPYTRYVRIRDKQIFDSLPYSVASGNMEELVWSEVWSAMTTYNHAYARYLASGDSNDYYSWRDATVKSYDTATKDSRLLDICTAAKDSGVIIFAIGFEAPAAGEQVMQSCASSSAHYYDVDGLEIADAFTAIATKITELRLVQ